MPSCNFLDSVLSGAKFQKIEKEIFKSIIDSLKQSMIVHKDNLLWNGDVFDDYYSTYQYEKEKLEELIRKDYVFNGEFGFDTEFPDYVEVIPLPDNGFDLRLID